MYGNIYIIYRLANLAKYFDISESKPRKCGRQTTRANHLAETPKQY